MPKTFSSKTALLLGTALLLAVPAVGVTLAASDHGRGRSETTENSGERGYRMAGEHGARRLDDGRHERHAEADEEDNDDESGPSPQASSPNAPVPDNGLFNGAARPKVDVR